MDIKEFKAHIDFSSYIFPTNKVKRILEVYGGVYNSSNCPTLPPPKEENYKERHARIPCV